MSSDAQWERIAPALSGKVGDAGSSGRDNRLFIEAVLLDGSPWRDLREGFGKWFTVYTRFWRWAPRVSDVTPLSALGQSRRYGRMPVTSALPRKADDASNQHVR